VRLLDVLFEASGFFVSCKLCCFLKISIVFFSVTIIYNHLTALDMASEGETPVVRAEAPASATATAAEPAVPAPVVESHAQAPVEADVR